MALSSAGETVGLRKAAAIIAEAVKAKAEAIPSRKIPPTVRSFVRAGIGYVTAGGTGGQQAPNAYMFEELGARHPLFAQGPKGTGGGWKHWYEQPYRPFMEEGAEVAADAAAEAFADEAIAIWAKESGYK